MYLGSRLWTSVSYILNLATLSPLENPGAGDQAPQVTLPDQWQNEPLLTPANIPSVPQDDAPGFIPFTPPGGATTGPYADFKCDYPNLGADWHACSTPTDRACWLKNDKLKQKYDINTNYEDTSVNSTPPGVSRYYELYLHDGWVNADGLNFTYAKIFNGSYPGPWIQACWGDKVSINVFNRLEHNGTSIHWHGIRQFKTMHMDGVNGVTQCPIAPGDNFTYTWHAFQYGSSWYHSHFAVQYADGALGPLTLHGPTSATFDEAVDPILMTDWGHNSAFEAIWSGLKAPSVLLNGTGDLSLANNVTQVPYDSEVPKRYTLKVDPPTRRGVKRYLLRLINTSFESTFVFSIDNHYLQIVSADFVPIHPYWNTSVLVGIGQRYNVIVEATHPLADVDDYWISVQRASCFNLPKLPPGKDYLALGALRYGDSTDNPLTSVWPDIDLRCSDEEFSSLRPILPWKVGPAANNKTHSTGDQNVVEISNGLQSEIFPLARFSLGTEKFLPFQIDYEDPTFLHLNYTGQWNPLRVMILENYTSTDWVYMVLEGDPTTFKTVGAHPIHLHGHDFAILQQIENANFPDKLNLKLDNPPRRDVVLLPQNGYAIIAFKADNPGVWIMHCHIAFHASFGLALQIMENQQAAIGLWPSFRESEALNATRKTCETWNRWAGNCKNWWPGDGSTCGAGMNEFAPDSGI